jgi:hypothetical protein
VDARREAALRHGPQHEERRTSARSEMLLLSAALETMRASCACGRSLLARKSIAIDDVAADQRSFRTLVLPGARDLRAAYPDEPIHRRFPRYAAPLMTTTGELSGFLAARAFPRGKTSRS